MLSASPRLSVVMRSVTFDEVLLDTCRDPLRAGHTATVSHDGSAQMRRRGADQHTAGHAFTRRCQVLTHRGSVWLSDGPPGTPRAATGTIEMTSWNRTRTFVMALWLASACNVAEAGAEQITIDYAYASRVLAQLDVINALVIEAAHSAAGRAENKDVRDYARRLHMDHSFINRRVQAIAREQHVDLDQAVERLDVQLRAAAGHSDAEVEAKKQLEELRQLRAEIAKFDVVHGAAYDARFVEAMERANQIAIYHLSAARSGVVQPVQDLIARVVPIFSQHVQLAWALQPDPRRATAGT